MQQNDLQFSATHPARDVLKVRVLSFLVQKLTKEANERKESQRREAIMLSPPLMIPLRPENVSGFSLAPRIEAGTSWSH
jgi:hypothetical protein